MMNDKFREECGVFGIWGHADAAACAALGLVALQHRGQESAGVAASCNGRIERVCRAGSAINLLADEEVKALSGSVAIGHVRYSTVGGTGLRNAQPIVLDCPQAHAALCHNGQIVNFEDLRIRLSELGATWLTSSDSELVLQLCKVSKQAGIIDAIIEALSQVQGAFSLLLVANDELIVARDPHGFRPLCMGRLGEAVVVCSETCALDAVGATYVREIEPGEITVISPAGATVMKRLAEPRSAHCVFEHIYFARPDSYVFGDHVGSVRVRLGRQLAREAPVDADIIVPVPESGTWAALGYQAESGLPLRLGFVRNPYVGRTFIEPFTGTRGTHRKLKLNPVPNVLDGQRVVLIDDSIVRGETMARIVNMARQAGAEEVHVRIASPPTIASCFYGIDTPVRSQLIAAEHSVEEIRETIGAASLAYLSLESLLDAVGQNGGNYCTACYTGNYRVLPPGLARSSAHDCVACTQPAFVDLEQLQTTGPIKME